jgi:hypothetical protein
MLVNLTRPSVRSESQSSFGTKQRCPDPETLTGLPKLQLRMPIKQVAVSPSLTLKQHKFFASFFS